jgi:hypothetical protein
MEGEIDVFDFILAEKLGMTLAQVGEMSNNEYLRWKAFYVYRRAMQELDSKEMK